MKIVLFLVKVKTLTIGGLYFNELKVDIVDRPPTRMQMNAGLTVLKDMILHQEQQHPGQTIFTQR